MKNGKKPTNKQKKLLKERGLNPSDYLIVKDLPDYMEAVSRVSVTKHKIFGIKRCIKRIEKAQINDPFLKGTIEKAVKICDLPKECYIDKG